MKTADKCYLVTGSAGFIGFHVAKKLLEAGSGVIGVDNFNEYYDPSLKEARNKQLEGFSNYTLYRGDISDLDFVKKIFDENKINTVCHLAAQAGVRYSLKNPHAYIQSNIVGFTNLIDEAKNTGIKNFIYASSSSVYGNHATAPFSETMETNSPVSLYAATKKASEIIAYSYYHLYGMYCTGLRFFTVYGPWGRPDMAYFSFAEAILEGRPIQVFNNGKMRRDFTYIDDVVDGIIRSCEHPQGYAIINLGNDAPIELAHFIEVLEKALGKEGKKEYLPMQPGDVFETHADISSAKEKLGWQPRTTIEEGIGKFVEWYIAYYRNRS